MPKATTAQVNYARELIQKLGYDLDNYDLENMDRPEISDLIAELLDEWEG